MLHQLWHSLDGNLLTEVDSVLRLMDSIQSNYYKLIGLCFNASYNNILELTISNNCLECESEVVKVSEYLITCKFCFCCCFCLFVFSSLV